MGHPATLAPCDDPLPWVALIAKAAALGVISDDDPVTTSTPSESLAIGTDDE